MQTQKGLAEAQGAAVIAEPSYFTGDILTHQHTKLIFAQLEEAGFLRGKAGTFFTLIAIWHIMLHFIIFLNPSFAGHISHIRALKKQSLGR